MHLLLGFFFLLLFLFYPVNSGPRKLYCNLHCIDLKFNQRGGSLKEDDEEEGCGCIWEFDGAAAVVLGA